jgi:RNA-directed DNA polymerase
LHQWATGSPGRRFSDLSNLVCDPAFLTVGWDRVRGNRGARTAGVDGLRPRSIDRRGERFLRGLRDDLKTQRFHPLPVRERMIPKASGKKRRLGIPTAADRVVQASLKLVLEPIFEADFHPCSYGFRPKRRAQDAIEEIRHFTARSYEWIVDGDIASCFDEINHPALMDRVRARVADKRVLGLVKAFLHAGILTEAGQIMGTKTGTPQGGILSPLLANIALSVLDDHHVEAWKTMMATDAQRAKRRRHEAPNYRLVRYADDFVILVAGTRQDAEALVDDTASVLATIGLRLSPQKTRVCHIDEGFEFLGFRIQRQAKPGSKKAFVYSWPRKEALASIKAKIKTISKQGTSNPLHVLLSQINLALRGWTVYFRHGASSRTFNYLRHYSFWRVARWLRRKHKGAAWKTIRRRYLNQGWPHDEGVELFNPAAVAITRYRYRGTKIPNPWTTRTPTTTATK